MNCQYFATSFLSLPIFLYQFSPERKKEELSRVLVVGGVHGNEPEGVIAAKALTERCRNNFPFSFELSVIPEFNPEGLLSNSRLNSRGVDLNRNLPTKDWSKEAFSPKYPPGETSNSEPENQALVKWIENNSPSFVISIHSFEKYMMNINGDCREMAEAMKKINSYPIEESIGYPTPGCLGTYCGLERGQPTITYEIERGLAIKEIASLHVEAIWQALSCYNTKII